LHHLSIAFGSLMETETVLSVGHRRGFTSKDDHERAMDLSLEVGRLILGMITSLRRARGKD
jgi:four helix bundle protein